MTVLDLTVVDLGDEAFKISTAADVDDLAKSIQHVGLINPPILIQKGDRYIIVAGFLRIAAMQQLNLLQTPAKVMPADSTDLACIRISITDNISQRKLDLLETSRALALLSECLNDRDRLVVEAQALGLAENRHHIEKMIGLCRLPQRIQEGVHQNRISMNMAFNLQGLDSKAKNLLTSLFMELKFNHNKQKEIYTHLKEIAHREKCSLTEVLLSEGFSDILADMDLDSPQKTGIIRSKLRHRRYPHLSRAEETFKRNLRKLNLGERIHIIPPAYFEEMSLKLSMSFKNENEFKEQMDILNRTLANPHLKNIFHSR
jgi:ParB family transcriptional regulator, chromosome partitioning protein